MRFVTIIVGTTLLLAGCGGQGSGPFGDSLRLPASYDPALRVAGRCYVRNTSSYAHAPTYHAPPTRNPPADFQGEACATLAFKIDAQGEATDVKLVSGFEPEVIRYAENRLSSIRFDQPAKPTATMLFQVGVVQKFDSRRRLNLALATNFY